MPQVYTGHDIALRRACTLIIPVLGQGDHAVKFQFPPRILSDNRRGTWGEGEQQGTEPIAVFKTSGPREITLSWTYIAAGGEFTPTVIANEVHYIRGYFASVRDRKERQRNLVCYFKYILFGSQNSWTARINSIDVKHGDTIVTEIGDRAFRADASFPLRTDITVDLRLWTKGGADEKTQDLQPLKPNEVFEWY
jgi:hypothetical protein